MAHIVTRTDRGRRMVQIPTTDAEEMVERGDADVIRRGVLYVDRALSRPKMVKSEPESLEAESELVEEEPLEYETRELKAEPVRSSRRRGKYRRPVTPNVSD